MKNQNQDKMSPKRSDINTFEDEDRFSQYTTQENEEGSLALLRQRGLRPRPSLSGDSHLTIPTLSCPAARENLHVVPMGQGARQGLTHLILDHPSHDLRNRYNICNCGNSDECIRNMVLDILQQALALIDDVDHFSL